MKNDLNHALHASLSGIRLIENDKYRILHTMREEQVIVKRKLSLGFVLVLILLLVTLTALAVTRLYWSLEDKAMVYPEFYGLPTADEITEEAAVKLAINALISKFGMEPMWFEGRRTIVYFVIDNPDYRYYSISFEEYYDNDIYYYVKITAAGEILEVSGSKSGNG